MDLARGDDDLGDEGLELSSRYIRTIQEAFGKTDIDAEGGGIGGTDHVDQALKKCPSTRARTDDGEGVAMAVELVGEL